MAAESRKAIYASVAANVAIAITKFIVGSIAHSTAMLAEAVHSLVNCFDGGLLLLGQRRSRRPADDAHPFGYGRELYFWSLIVAILFFALGAGVTVYEGVRHVIEPGPLGDPTWSYVVIVFSGDGRIYGLSASDGKTLWVDPRTNPPLTVRNAAGGVVSRGGLFVGTAGGRLLAIDAPTGTVAWDGTVATPKGATRLSACNRSAQTSSSRVPSSCARSWTS